MGQVIRIKPHHFIDIIRDIGKGRSQFDPHPYGHAVHSVAEAIIENPNLSLQLELGCDDICAPCKKMIDGSCIDTIDTSFRPDAPSSKQDYNRLIDRRWCERLGLIGNECLTARAFCERLQNSMGDITEIYRETPNERTSIRSQHIKAGIVTFMAYFS